MNIPEQVSQPASDPNEIGKILRQQLAKAIGCNESEIDPTREFMEFGISSFEGMALLGDIEELVGMRLPDSLLWDYSNLERLTQHLKYLAASKK